MIYASDQGFYMGEHGWFDKRFMYEESFRTPMVMRYPGKVKPGQVSEQMVMNLDLGPTILEAANVAIPSDMQGESFLKSVTGHTKKGRNAVYYHYYENGEHSVSPHFGVSNGRYKLIRFYKRVESWELFDLQKDPQELVNLISNKKYSKIKKKMLKKLKAAINKYEDEDALNLLQVSVN